MQDSLIRDFPLAVYGQREVGRRVVVEIRSGVTAGEAFWQDGRLVVAPHDLPALVAEVEIPDGLALAECEAAATEAIRQIKEVPTWLERYGWASPDTLTETKIAALSRIVFAAESFCRLAKAWNYAERGPDGQVTLQPIDAITVARVFGDPMNRAGWTLQLESLSPLERSEGNVSPVSPSGISDEAGDTAAAAPAFEGPAPEAAEPSPESSAPGLSTPPEPSPDASPSESPSDPES